MVFRFQVWVASSPAGSTAAETRQTPAQLRRDLQRLEHRGLVLDDMIALGEMLTGLLIPAHAPHCSPPASRLWLGELRACASGCWAASRAGLHPMGVSLRPSRGRGQGQHGIPGAGTGRISIARQETPSMPWKRPVAKFFRLVVAQADPQEEGWPPLTDNLIQERANTESVLKDSEVRPTFLVPATMDDRGRSVVGRRDAAHQWARRLPARPG